MRESEGYRETLADIKQVFGSNVGMLTVNQVAQYLNCDRRTVVQIIKKGKLHAKNIGLSNKNCIYRIPMDSLARFMTNKDRW